MPPTRETRTDKQTASTQNNSKDPQGSNDADAQHAGDHGDALRQGSQWNLAKILAADGLVDNTNGQTQWPQQHEMLQSGQRHRRGEKTQHDEWYEHG